MAVFPTARRAFARPARLPWLVAATALITLTLTIPLATALVDTSRPADPGQAVADTSTSSSLSLEGEGRGEGDFPNPSLASSTTSATGSVASSIAIDEATISEAVLATEAEAYLQALLAQLETTTETSIAEVSQEPVRIVADAVPETAAATTAAAPTTVAPATNTQPAAEVPPPAPVVAPAQQAPVTPAGPVERWAAAGVVIVTAGQDLDDHSLANVDAALSVLPPSVLSNLGNPAFGPLHILVNTRGQVLSGDRPYGGPANFFSTNEATNELVLYPQQSVFTIVHELGHAYNLRRIGAGRYAMVLLDPEMRSFLAATGWQITSTDSEIRSAVDHMHVAYTYTGSFHWPRLSNDDPLEDFANSFAMFFLDPGSLQQSSPERYAWMAGTFGR